jgi:hypothetical protein
MATVDNLDARRAELETQRARLIAVRDSRDFCYYLELVQAQLIMQRAMLMQTPLINHDSAFAIARAQGVVAGLAQAISTIEQHLQAVQGSLDALYIEIEEENARS